jgi:hypothetical protein
MLIIPVAMVVGGGGGGTARPRRAGEDKARAFDVLGYAFLAVRPI